MFNADLKYRFYGKITYTIDREHPDVRYVKDWAEDKVLEFEDHYYFGTDYTVDEVKSYIEHDLMLVAGGGYKTDHVHNVKFEIRQA